MSQHFTEVGQHPRSMDCGFFAGYVLGLYDAKGFPGLGNMMMSAQNVYDARSAFYTRVFNGNPPPDKLLNGPHGRAISNGLEASQAVDYLKGLTCPGYHITPGPGKSADGIRAMLHSHLACPPNYAGILLCIDSLISAHWITVLYRTATAGAGTGANSPAAGGDLPGTLATLKWGSKSDLVALLQANLNAAGKSRYPRLVEDGVFGQNTYNRVREFQQSQQGLAVDGIVGPNTWGRLLPETKGAGSVGSASVAVNSSSYTYGVYNPGLLNSHFYGSNMSEQDLVDDLTSGGVNYVVWRHQN